MTEPVTEAAEAPESDRIDRLEDRQAEQGEALTRIEAMLAKVIPGSHAEAERREEHRLDRGSNLAEQVRAELQKARDDEARAKADTDTRNAELSEREQIKADLAALREKPPAPPRNPVKKLATMGWGDG
jgi:hypothetical protein